MGYFSSQRNKVPLYCFLFFCLSLFLTAYSSKHPEVGRRASGLVGSFMRPFQGGIGASVGWFTGLLDEYVLLIGVKQQNVELLSRLGALDAMATEVKELRRENDDLRRILKMLDRPALEGVVASIIGASPSRWIEGITIDRGESDGVRVGMPVVTEQGVVGQVIVASRHSARVLLLTDRVSGIDSIIQSSRARGIVEGVGERRCQLRYVGSRETAAVGDRVITSGLDGVFPRGLLVGTVTAVRGGTQGIFQSIEVEPAVSPQSIERVIVLNKVPEDMEESPPPPSQGEVELGEGAPSVPAGTVVGGEVEDAVSQKAPSPAPPAPQSGPDNQKQPAKPKRVAR